MPGDFATSAGLTAFLLDRHGVGVLPGDAFGDDPAALRVRVATSLLYGETAERRLAALEARDPLGLPGSPPPRPSRRGSRRSDLGTARRPRLPPHGPVGAPRGRVIHSASVG
nr:hypothetical protein GCM10020093_074720 [Planobispora longispora]